MLLYQIFVSLDDNIIFLLLIWGCMVLQISYAPRTIAVNKNCNLHVFLFW